MKMDILPTLDESACTLLRSQSGPAAGTALLTTPSNPATRINSALFRVLLLSLAPVSASFLTPLATIAQSAVEQECWGGEGLQKRVWAHGFSAKLVHELPPMRLCDLDLSVPNVHDGMNACHCSVGSSWWWISLSPRPNAAVRDGVALQAARRRKERTYPELVGPRARPWLVVWAGKVGGLLKR